MTTTKVTNTITRGERIVTTGANGGDYGTIKRVVRGLYGVNRNGYVVFFDDGRKLTIGDRFNVVTAPSLSACPEHGEGCATWATLGDDSASA